MTSSQLVESLLGCEPSQSISALGDRFVSRSLTCEDDFWANIEKAREFYSLLTLFHHGSAAGLEAIVDYNENLWVPIVSYCSKILPNIGSVNEERVLKWFDGVTARSLSKGKLETLPADLGALRQLQDACAEVGLEWLEDYCDEIEQRSETLIGCAEGDFAQKFVSWLHANADEIAPLI